MKIGKSKIIKLSHRLIRCNLKNIVIFDQINLYINKGIVMNINSHLLGDILKSMGILTQTQLNEALLLQGGIVADNEPEPQVDRVELVTESRDKGKEVPRLAQVLLDNGYITKDLLAHLFLPWRVGK
jgi:hypothetical protein